MYRQNESRSHLLLLTSIILLAALIRLLDLSELPNGFFMDEASTGYDAYSLMLTGRDQYGAVMPVFARSFGDYNEALYRYLVIPAIWLFGLGEFAVRLPAAVVGTLTVLVVYALTRQLFGAKAGLFSALVLAISPWHVLFSRVAFRAPLFPFFFCLAVLLLLRGLDNSKILIWSAVAFAASLYTYSAARVFVPLFLAFSVLLFRRRLLEARRHLIVSLLIFVGILIPLGLFWISPVGMSRANDLIARTPGHWLLNYLSYFDVRFLFTLGDPDPRHSVDGMGQLHLVEAVTLLVGLVGIMKAERWRFLLLFTWLVLYPIPAAFTTPYHALRSIIGVPVFAIISGLGASTIVSFSTRKRELQWAFSAGLVLILCYSFLFFVQRYFGDYKRNTASSWLYGMREAISLAEEFPSVPVFLSDQLDVPHIFVLFYSRYPPEQYHTSPFYPGKEVTDIDIGRYHIGPSKDVDRFVYDKARCVIIVPSHEASLACHNIPCRPIRIIRAPDNLKQIHVLEYTKVP